MRKSSAPHVCARFIMLSLSGARQISGKSVRMSIRISNVRRISRNVQAEQRCEWQCLLDDLERRAMSVPRRGAGEQSADRLNRLPVATDDPADVALPHHEPKHRRVRLRAFRDDHFVGKLDQITDDEFEKLFHALSVAARARLSPVVSVRLPLSHKPGQLRVRCN